MEQILDLDQKQIVDSHVVNAIDIELTRVLNEEKIKHVIDRLSTYYYSHNLYSFFVLRNLKEISEEIFQDVVMRDFILNLESRVTYTLAMNETPFAAVINTVVQSVCDSRARNVHSLINKEVNDTLFIEPQNLRIILQSNMWLCVLYIGLMNFNQTEVFKLISQSN